MSYSTTETIPVYLIILNPAFVFACTVEVIEPSVLLAVVPPLALQHQATNVLALLLL